MPVLPLVLVHIKSTDHSLPCWICTRPASAVTYFTLLVEYSVCCKYKPFLVFLKNHHSCLVIHTVTVLIFQFRKNTTKIKMLSQTTVSGNQHTLWTPSVPESRKSIPWRHTQQELCFLYMYFRNIVLNQTKLDMSVRTRLIDAYIIFEFLHHVPSRSGANILEGRSIPPPWRSC
jgi:hypothetical protein